MRRDQSSEKQAVVDQYACASSVGRHAIGDGTADGNMIDATCQGDACLVFVWLVKLMVSLTHRSGSLVGSMDASTVPSRMKLLRAVMQRWSRWQRNKHGRCRPKPKLKATRQAWSVGESDRDMIWPAAAIPGRHYSSMLMRSGSMEIIRWDVGTAWLWMHHHHLQLGEAS